MISRFLISVSQPLGFFLHLFKFSISHSALAGHKGYRGGISSSRPHGLPSWPPSAHVGLLAERPSRPTQIRPDRRHLGQNDPQPQHLKNADGNVYTVRTPIPFHFFFFFTAHLYPSLLKDSNAIHRPALFLRRVEFACYVLYSCTTLQCLSALL